MVDIFDLVVLLSLDFLLGHPWMSVNVEVAAHLAVFAVNVQRFFSELPDPTSGGVADYGNVAGRVQIDTDPVLDLAWRQLVDRHGDERELLVQLDLVDLLECRKMTGI